MVDRRVIICTEALFPRGNANANYIEYVALALMNQGIDVTVIACNNKNNNNDSYSNEKEYKGIRYYTYNSRPINKVKRILNSVVFNGIHVKNILFHELSIKKEDIILIYSHNFLFIKPFYKKLKKNGNRVAMCITEDFQPFYYKNGKFDFQYLRFKYTKRFVLGKCDYIIPISSHLEEYYKKLGCKTMVLPAMANSHEYEYYDKKYKNTINLIYSGNGYCKDSYEVMLKALDLLTENERKQVRLNFTGISYETLVSLIGKQEELIKKLGDSVVIYPWMDYDELVELYQQMEYLLIPRIESIMTQANFPSKIPEMMCYGINPIINKIGDVVENLNDGNNAIIFEHCTEYECADAIKRILFMTYEERCKMHHAARKTAEDIFDYTKWGNKLAAFLAE